MIERYRDQFYLDFDEKVKKAAAALKAEEEFNRCHNRLSRWVVTKVEKLLFTVEQFISNLPLTIGAIALAIVTLGVVWFKFAEESLNSCQPVHFHSSQCTFPEFPGCFLCDTDNFIYKLALMFHLACSTIAGTLVVLFFAKVFFAWRVVIDEMCSPTTSSPAGLICMTMVCVFAGHGLM